MENISYKNEKYDVCIFSWCATICVLALLFMLLRNSYINLISIGVIFIITFFLLGFVYTDFMEKTKYLVDNKMTTLVIKIGDTVKEYRHFHFHYVAAFLLLYFLLVLALGKNLISQPDFTSFAITITAVTIFYAGIKYEKIINFILRVKKLKSLKIEILSNKENICRYNNKIWGNEIKNFSNTEYIKNKQKFSYEDNLIVRAGDYPNKKKSRKQAHKNENLTKQQIKNAKNVMVTLNCLDNVDNKNAGINQITTKQQFNKVLLTFWKKAEKLCKEKNIEASLNNMAKEVLLRLELLGMNEIRTPTTYKNWLELAQKIKKNQ